MVKTKAAADPPRQRSSNKRPKTGSNDREILKSLRELPEVVLVEVFSFVGFSDLLQLWATDRHWRARCNEEFEQWMLPQLPKSVVLDPNNEEGYEQFTLCDSWPEEFSSREGLIDKAMVFVDPGGQVSLDANVDGTVARRLLQQRGFVNMEDFLEEEEEQEEEDMYGGYFPFGMLGGSRRGDNDYGGYLEVGWSVGINYHQTASPKVARRILANWFLEMKENHEGRNFLALKQDMLCLFLGSRPGLIRYGKWKYDYHHTDYPSGGKGEALLLWTLKTNKPIAICFKSVFESH